MMDMIFGMTTSICVHSTCDQRVMASREHLDRKLFERGIGIWKGMRGHQPQVTHMT